MQPAGDGAILCGQRSCSDGTRRSVLPLAAKSYGPLPYLLLHRICGRDGRWEAEPRLRCFDGKVASQFSKHFRGVFGNLTTSALCLHVLSALQWVQMCTEACAEWSQHETIDHCIWRLSSRSQEDYLNSVCSKSSESDWTLIFKFILENQTHSAATGMGSRLHLVTTCSFPEHRS